MSSLVAPNVAHGFLGPSCHLEAPDTKAGFDKQLSDTNSDDEQGLASMPESGRWMVRTKPRKESAPQIVRSTLYGFDISVVRPR